IGPAAVDAPADLPPAGPARRADLHLRRLALLRLSRRAERVQRPEPRGDDLRLPLPRQRPGARPPPLAGDRPARAVLRRVLLMALLSIGACTPDFDDETTIKDLRVLGISADTPEILLEGGPVATQATLCPKAEVLQALATELATRLPDSFPPIVLHPLVVDP